MRILDFFTGKRKEQKTPTTEISENLFIEKGGNLNSTSDSIKKEAPSSNGISSLFEFLEVNYESKGYDDALINPDNTNLEQNIHGLKNDLGRTIRKVKIFYEDMIRDMDYHITVRARSGMIDLVEELQTKKSTAESHIKQVLEIEKEGKENMGPAHGIILSYTRGFRNGLAAITGHTLTRTIF